MEVEVGGNLEVEDFEYIFFLDLGYDRVKRFNNIFSILFDCIVFVFCFYLKLFFRIYCFYCYCENSIYNRSFQSSFGICFYFYQVIE